MLTSPSSSYLDLRAPGSQRIKRKPPPSIDLAERYPSPDPSDPFAPLWVLRNRTSSALLDRVSPAFAYGGVYGSQETLETPSERRRSMSYMNPSPLSQNVSKTLTEVRLVSVSPSPSPSPHSKPQLASTVKIGHYMPYSQTHAASATKLQAFPRIATPDASQVDVNISIATPKRTAGLYNPTRSSTPDDADLSDYYAMESDSSTSEAQFRPKTTPLRHVASHSLVYPYPIPLGGPRSNLNGHNAAGSISTVSNSHPKAESKLKLHSQLPAPRVEPAHLCFPKFLLPKKRSSLLGSPNISGNTKKISNSNQAETATATNNATNNERRRAIEPRKVHKASISAPQTIMSTVAWDPLTPPRNAPPHPQVPRSIQHQRSAMPMSTVKQDEDKENKKAVVVSSAQIQRSISLDISTACDNQKRLHLLIPAPSPWMQQQPKATDIGHPHTKIPNPAERPLLISVNNNIDDPRCDHHRTQKAAVQEQIKSHELPPQRNDTPVPGQRSFTTLAQPIPGAIKRMERSTSPALQARLETVLAKKNGSGTTKPRHSRMFSFPPLSLAPASPSTHSISGTSIVNISLPSSPTTFGWQHEEEEEAYTSPRPAPTPPPPVANEAAATETPKANTIGRTTPPSAASDNAHLHSSECQSTHCDPSGTGAKPTDPPPKPAREWTLPSEDQIKRAAALQVVCEDGTRVSFGSLFAAHRTIAVFIRHFWCPLCQDYMSSLKTFVQPEMLSRWSQAPDLRERLVSFVVISNGAHGMIRKYRRMFGLPFHVYTDPTLELYKVLGMRRDGDDGHRHLPGQRFQQQVPRTLSEKGAGGTKEQGNKRSGYVKHGFMGGIAMVVVRAIKVGMPVWEKGGDVGQLGGEFIFGPGLTCSFAHRMQTTKGHAPIEDVLEAAGIDVRALVGGKTGTKRGEEEDLVSSLGGIPTVGRGGRRRHESMRTVRETMIMRRRASAAQNQDDRRFSTVGGVMMTREEEEEWMAERQRQVEMLQERKNLRRGTSSRAASAMSSYARQDGEVHDDVQMSPVILEAVGELSDERAELEDRRESFESSRAGSGRSGDESDDEKTVEQASTVEDRPVRVRVPSMMETDSCYSAQSGEDDHFTDPETESDSWKMEQERNIQPTTSYLFIH